MTPDQLTSLERTVLALAVFILTVVLVIVSIGRPEFQTIWPALAVLDSGVAAYWFGQASK